MDKENAKQEVSDLIQVFKDNLKQYKLNTYKEAQVRKEFIDKFFKALGWDIDNKQGSSEQFKEVINEDAILWEKQLFDKKEKLDIKIKPATGRKVDITIRSINKIRHISPKLIKILEVSN